MLFLGTDGFISHPLPLQLITLLFIVAPAGQILKMYDLWHVVSLWHSGYARVERRMVKPHDNSSDVNVGWDPCLFEGLLSYLKVIWSNKVVACISWATVLPPSCSLRDLIWRRQGIPFCAGEARGFVQFLCCSASARKSERVDAEQIKMYRKVKEGGGEEKGFAFQLSLAAEDAPCGCSTLIKNPFTHWSL